MAELVEVFTDIYNMLLSTAWVPTFFKLAIIVPLTKQLNVTCLNDYRPVALTPIQAKLERLVMTHTEKSIPQTCDLFRFAYRQNRLTEDATAFVLCTLLEHLEQKNTHTRLLFVDFSLAFSKFPPQGMRASPSAPNTFYLRLFCLPLLKLHH